MLSRIKTLQALALFVLLGSLLALALFSLLH